MNKCLMCTYNFRVLVKNNRQKGMRSCYKFKHFYNPDDP